MSADKIKNISKKEGDIFTNLMALKTKKIYINKLI